jgi:hypothetical protein
MEEIFIVIVGFSIFFPCLSTNRVNCSVLFRFFNSTKTSSSINIHLKFLKYCRDEIINRSLLNQFYNSNQINDYLLIKECKFNQIKKKTIIKILFLFSSSSRFYINNNRYNNSLFINYCSCSFFTCILYSYKFILYISNDNKEEKNI